MMSNRYILTLLFFACVLGLYAQDKSISVISVEKANVVYRGITNPIKIAVPGAKSFKAEAYGELIKADNLGNYNWNVTSVAGTKGLIRIDAVMSDNSLIHEERLFEVKPIPEREGTIKTPYLSKTYEMSKDQLLNIELESIINNLNYSIDTSYNGVKSFELLFPNKESMIIKGNRLNKKAKLKIDSLSLGSVVFITNISQYKTNDSCYMRLPSLKIKIAGISEEEITPPQPVTALQNRNILYRGIDNQLDIGVPGAKSFTASAPGLRANGNGSYSWNVTKTDTNITHLNFEITTENDSVFFTTKMFHVKDMKPMRATINDRGCDNCIVEVTRSDVKDAKIGVGFEDLINDTMQHFIVKSFLLELPDGNLYRVGEGKFSESAQKMILQFPNGAIFKISEIDYVFCGFAAARPKMKFSLVDKYE